MRIERHTLRPWIPRQLQERAAKGDSEQDFLGKKRDAQANTDRSELGNNVTRYQGGSG